MQNCQIAVAKIANGQIVSSVVNLNGQRIQQVFMPVALDTGTKLRLQISFDGVNFVDAEPEGAGLIEYAFSANRGFQATTSNVRGLYIRLAALNGANAAVPQTADRLIGIVTGES